MATDDPKSRFAPRVIAALRTQRPDAVPVSLGEELAGLPAERATGVLMRDHGISAEELRQALVTLGVVIPGVPGYRLDAPVGRGGNGVVWRGEHLASAAVVAIKISRSTSPLDDVRFLREAKTATEVRHARIVPLLDVGVVGGLRYLALEFQPGGDAHDLAKRRGGTLAPMQALRLVAQAAQGLTALHAVGLVHRDCNPGNIFLDAGGGARLGDLGLVRRLDEQVTQTGVAIGTPGYLSPEQAVGDEVDERSDIFSMGATLFALLVGRAPFVADTPLASVTAAATGSVPDPRTCGADCGSDIAVIVRRATARNASARYANAQEFVADCEAVLAGNRPVIALRRRGGHRAVVKRAGGGRSWSALRPLLAAGLIIAVGCLAMGRWAGLWLSAPDRRDVFAAGEARQDPTVDGWRWYVERFPRGDAVDEGRTVIALADQLPALRVAQQSTQQRVFAEQESALSEQRAALMAQIDEKRAALAAMQAEHVQLVLAVTTIEMSATENERRRATVISAMIDRARNAAPPGCEVLLECKRLARLIILDPLDPQRILVAHQDGLASSDDNGVSWQQQDPMPFTPPGAKGYTVTPFADVHRAMWSGDRLYLDAARRGMQLTGLLSTDRGRSFRNIPAAPLLHDHPATNGLVTGSIMLPDGQLIAAAQAPDHFVRSVDDGQAWTVTRLRLPIEAVLPDERGALMLVGGNGVSRNDGRTWSEGQGHGGSNWGSVSRVTWDPQGLIEYGYGIRFFTRSGLGGIRTTENHGFIIGVARLSTNPLWVYAFSESYGLIHSIDGGKKWLRAAPALQAATAAAERPDWVPLAITATTPPRLLYQGSDGMIRRIIIDDEHTAFFPEPIRP